MNKLLLWDIDGTLIHGGGVAAPTMRAAMEQLFGPASSQERLSYAGKTDQQIALETYPHLEPAHILAALPEFSATYLAMLSAKRAAFLEHARPLDGVVPLLEQLRTHDGLVLGLLTGNLQPVAQLKLDLLGLSGYFDFAASAFGSDHHRRTELVPLAAERAARRYGHAFSGSAIVVIGDTPHDIACGRAGGARTVAVASGPFSLEELYAHSPDAVLPSLADTTAALAAILA